MAAEIPPFVGTYNSSQELLWWMEDQRQQHGDIFRASVYGSNVYVVSDPQYVDHVLRKNWQNYRKGLAVKRVELLLGRGLISSEGEFWKSQRRLIQPAFHTKVIAGMNNVIVDANAKLLDKWLYAARSTQSVNITHDISVMVLELVLTSIFGEDYEQVAPRFNILADESARDLQFAHAFRPLRAVVSEVAARRRAEKRVPMDYLGMLMEARDRDTGHGMPDGQLTTEIMTLIVAGHETTALTLNWCWYLLSRNADAEQHLAKEINQQLHEDELPSFTDLVRFTYTAHIIYEALRLYPPVWVITRKAMQDDRLGEYSVPTGTEIYFSPYIIQRHPRHWQTPNDFNPNRFDANQAVDRHALAWHPFSAGPRSCIAEHLARFEMQIHLIMIAKKLRLRALDDRPLDFDIGVNLRNKNDFIMMPTMAEG